MILSNEQAKQLHEKLAAVKNPEEAAKTAKELGIDLSAENMEEILAKVSGGAQELSDDVLEKISGGAQELDIPQYEIIRDYYREKGPNLAFILCIYYIPSPICYEIIQVIENEEGLLPPSGYQPVSEG